MSARVMKSPKELGRLLFPEKHDDPVPLTGPEWRELIFQAYEHCAEGASNRNECGGRTEDERALSALREMAHGLFACRFGGS